MMIDVTDRTSHRWKPTNLLNNWVPAFSAWNGISSECQEISGSNPRRTEAECKAECDRRNAAGMMVA